MHDQPVSIRADRCGAEGAPRSGILGRPLATDIRQAVRGPQALETVRHGGERLR